MQSLKINSYFNNFQILTFLLLNQIIMTHYLCILAIVLEDTNNQLLIEQFYRFESRNPTFLLLDLSLHKLRYVASNIREENTQPILNTHPKVGTLSNKVGNLPTIGFAASTRCILCSKASSLIFNLSQPICSFAHFYFRILKLFKLILI